MTVKTAVRLNRGLNGESITVDEMPSGELMQRVKVALGATGVDGGNVTATNPFPVAIGDSANLDSFQRLRVSNPSFVFDAQLTYDLQPLLFDAVTAGANATVTHDATNRQALMTFASTPTGGKAFMQSFEHFRYQPGRSQLSFVTFNFNGGVANVLKFAGYSAGATNGIELQMNGATARLALYSDTDLGDEFVNQADWDDPMDGTGASGLTVNWSKGQIFAIDFQALYKGRVRCYLDIGGSLVKFHQFNHSNVDVGPYIQSANLPIRAGMTCTGTVSTTMTFNCASVISEGGQVEIGGYEFSVEGTATAANGARTHILSIQPALTFNSIVNRSKLILDSFDILAGANPIEWELCLGDVLTGTTTFLNVNAAYSATQHNILGTTSGTPGIVIAAGYIASATPARGSKSGTITTRYPITLDAAGAARAMGRLTMLLTGIGGTSASRVVFNWRELR